MHPRRSSGHTLLELLVVVIVLMIIAGIVIPSSTVGAERKLDTLQVAMQDAINEAQTLAYHQGAAFGVRFDVTGQFIAVVDETGTPTEDPFTHGPYVLRLTTPSPVMPSDMHIDYANFDGRPLAAFNEKGVLIVGGEVHVRAGDTPRWLVADTATNTLMEIPAGP
ncbi:MAG TPA: prepilin-type N-terminal cleavage/methylation domain-containing protein [Planctomycetota bacterium]|nr:prepilin-type N-terminal cleavage/methylation domain-containing protein [Planctomycetota bacterium]